MNNDSKLRESVRSLLVCQDLLNVLVLGRQDWQVMPLKWHVAVWVEAGELLGHFGTWEWWKTSTTDFPQLKLELVDLWHFGSSLMLKETDKNFEAVTDRVISAIPSESTVKVNKHDFVDLINKVVADASQYGRFNVGAFFLALSSINITFSTFERYYIGKVELNEFRQANGYNTNSYVKNWGGEEDNFYLALIIENLPEGISKEDFQIRLKDALKIAYHMVKYGATKRTIMAKLGMD